MVLFPFHRGLNLLRLLGTKHWLLDIQRAYGWRSCAFLLKPVCVLRCPLELKLYLLFDHVFSPLQDFTGKWHIHYPIVMKICHLNPTGLFYPKTPYKYCYGCMSIIGNALLEQESLRNIIMLFFSFIGSVGTY